MLKHTISLCMFLVIGCGNKQTPPRTSVQPAGIVLVEGIDTIGESHGAGKTFVRLTLQEKNEVLLTVKDDFVYGETAADLTSLVPEDDKQLIPMIKNMLAWRYAYARTIVQCFERIRDAESELEALRARKKLGNPAMETVIAQKEAWILANVGAYRIFTDGHHKGVISAEDTLTKHPKEAAKVKFANILITKLIKAAKDPMNTSRSEQVKVLKNMGRFSDVYLELQSPIVIHAAGS